MNAVSAFSANYAQAREKFLAAARRAGLEVTSYPHPLPGCDGEALALDVALLGVPDASRLLMVSSGCHGVEGYCGSGVQVMALRDSPWLEQTVAAGVAVLFLHGINPYGFSHTRRVTHENVDLNRNFPDFSAPLPDGRAYRALHALLLPEAWPPDAQNAAALQMFIAGHGMKAVQAAVTGGQYEIADGLFFGGSAPTWSNLTLRRVLRRHASRAAHIAWIDLHTGLGPKGHGERSFGGAPNDLVGFARATEWWGGGGATPLTSIDNGTSVSAPVTGVMWKAAFEECRDAQITVMAIEFGTQPLMQVLQALRAEQWLQNNPEAPAAMAAQIKRDLRDAFYVDEPEWKQQIVAQSMQSLHQAVHGLAAT